MTITGKALPSARFVIVLTYKRPNEGEHSRPARLGTYRCSSATTERQIRSVSPIYFGDGA